MAQKVNPDLAADCVAKYQDLYQSDDVAAIKKAYTDAISFSAASIRAFLDTQPGCDTLTIVPGVYTADYAAKYGTVEGRLAAFLYATSSKDYGNGLGNPVPPDGDPLNIGDLTP